MSQKPISIADWLKSQKPENQVNVIRLSKSEFADFMKALKLTDEDQPEPDNKVDPINAPNPLFEEIMKVMKPADPGAYMYDGPGFPFGFPDWVSPGIPDDHPEHDDTSAEASMELKEALEIVQSYLGDQMAAAAIAGNTEQLRYLTERPMIEGITEELKRLEYIEGDD